MTKLAALLLLLFAIIAYRWKPKPEATWTAGREDDDGIAPMDPYLALRVRP